MFCDKSRGFSREVQIRFLKYANNWDAKSREINGDARRHARITNEAYEIFHL